MKRLIHLVAPAFLLIAGLVAASTASSHPVSKVDRIDGSAVIGGGSGPCKKLKEQLDYLCNHPHTDECYTAAAGNTCQQNGNACPQPQLTIKNSDGWRDNCATDTGGKNTCSPASIDCTVTQTCGTCIWVTEGVNSWFNCTLASQVGGNTQTDHVPTGAGCP